MQDLSGGFPDKCIVYNDIVDFVVVVKALGEDGELV